MFFQPLSNSRPSIIVTLTVSDSSPQPTTYNGSRKARCANSVIQLLYVKIVGLLDRARITGFSTLPLPADMVFDLPGFGVGTVSFSSTTSPPCDGSSRSQSSCQP